MPVVINDFEVVTEQPPRSDRAATGGETPSAEQARGATPHEIESILRREQERLARVQAH